MFDWAIAGVNVSIPSEGGVECAAYSPVYVRIFESVAALGIALCVFINARSNPSFSNIPYLRRNSFQTPSKSTSHAKNELEHTKNSREFSNGDELINDTVDVYSSVNDRKTSQIVESTSDRNQKNWLLVLLCLVWGAEIGFKFASRTVIYLLNPCHVVTAVQIYLLAAEPSSKVTIIFRLHLYFLNGAILAFLFPNTESRILPCESSLYWIQHSTMLIVPIYLLCLKGVYNVEPIRDLSWGILAYSMNMVYHFAFLQPLALMSEVNLNQLLCPAQLDPFRGTYYRTIAVIHQSVLCQIVAKTCSICASFLTSSPVVYSEPLEANLLEETNSFNCDKNLCQKSENAAFDRISVNECKSCLGKDEEFAENPNPGVDKITSHFEKSDSPDLVTITPMDSANLSKAAKESSFQLRQRNVPNDIDE